jgi:hypothetical protein
MINGLRSLDLLGQIHFDDWKQNVPVKACLNKLEVANSDFVYELDFMMLQGLFQDRFQYCKKGRAKIMF